MTRHPSFPYQYHDHVIGYCSRDCTDTPESCVCVCVGHKKCGNLTFFDFAKNFIKHAIPHDLRIFLKHLITKPTILRNNMKMNPFRVYTFYKMTLSSIQMFIAVILRPKRSPYDLQKRRYGTHSIASMCMTKFDTVSSLLTVVETSFWVQNDCIRYLYASRNDFMRYIIH